jgi:hypothetical protein
VPINVFSGAKTIFGGRPSKNVLLITRDRLDGGDGLNSLVSKSVGKNFHIPRTSVGNP